jgi:hypothetical protein
LVRLFATDFDRDIQHNRSLFDLHFANYGGEERVSGGAARGVMVKALQVRPSKWSRPISPFSAW